MNKEKRTVKLLVLALVISIIFGYLYPFTTGSRLGVSFLTAVMVLVAGGWAFFNTRGDKEVRENININVKNFFWIFLITSLCALVVFLLIFISQEKFIEFQQKSDWSSGLSWEVFAATMLFYAVISIPLQEYIFRGYIMSVFLVNTKKVWLAITVSSILYSLSHLHYGWALMAITLIFGFFVGWLQYRTKNLLFPIMAHMFGGLGIFLVIFLYGIL